MRNAKNEEHDPQAAGSAPQVHAIRRDGNLWSKRAFLTAATGSAAGITVACSVPPNAPNDVVPPFAVGGTTYRLVDLKNYNAVLPATGTSLAVVGFVVSDYFFRYFNGQGTLTINEHESATADAAGLKELKTLATNLNILLRSDEAEQLRFAQLFGVVTSDAGRPEATSGRRMQGSDGRVARGRRMQGSKAKSAVSGRRMQGAEGRVEAGSPQRPLGILTINNDKYADSRIEETYTNGYTRLRYAGGVAVVRTDDLPELVRMQLPVAVEDPAGRPSTTITRTVVHGEAPHPMAGAPRSRPAPAEEAAPRRPAPAETPPPYRESETDHYWRPN